MRAPDRGILVLLILLAGFVAGFVYAFRRGEASACHIRLKARYQGSSWRDHEDSRRREQRVTV
jgi:hypothetical protein